MTITGVVDFVFATVQMFGFKYFAEKQAFRFRALYVESVLHQDQRQASSDHLCSLAFPRSVSG